MSAFLGPVHVKMYDRILYQDEMSGALLDLAAANSWGHNLQKEVDAKAPAASRQPLEAIIDESNIHGWLSEAVARCETRFSLVVCGILKGHPERLDELRQTMRAQGKIHSLPPTADAEQAYQTVHDILLDGMPCDFPFSTTETSGAIVAWQVTNCPHAPYWTDDICGAQTYYQLRDAWMDGALENSGIEHSRTKPFTHILKAR